MTRPNWNCLTPAELEAYADGGPLSDSAAEHVRRCETCQSAVSAIRENNTFLRDFSPQLRRAATVLEGERMPPDAVPGLHLIREAHRGGQGVVYEAIQQSTGQKVAVKVLREGLFASPRERARFEREAAALARFDHPGIVPIRDRGRTANHDYLVMRFVDGAPLDQWLATQGLLPGPDREGSGETRGLPRLASGRARLERIARVFIDICDAVHAAHQRGVIHRDLKPGNILVDSAGRPHVLDFGLAKLADEADEPQDATRIATQTGHFVGSLPWASPEQAAGAHADIDVRTDVYALGVMLFHALTGRFPYDVSGSIRAVLENILTAQPPRPASLVRGLESDLETIVLKSLAKEKSRRYDSVAALGRDLRHFLAREPIEARRDSLWYVLRKTVQRNRLPIATATLVFLLALFYAVERARYAGSLENALHLANIDRGRSEGRAGGLAVAEPILWREHLTPPARARDAGRSEGTLATFWALWELYSQQPCLAVWDAGYELRSSALSPAGNRLAVVNSAGRLELWIDPISEPDPARIAIELPVEATTAPVFSPDGRFLLIGCADGAIRTWQTGHAAPGPVWCETGRRIEHLAVHPQSGQLATVDADGAVTIRQREPEASSRRLALDAPVTHVQFDPVRPRLAAAAPGTSEIRLISTHDGRTLGTIDISSFTQDAHELDRIGALSFSADGRYLAAACYRFACVWDADSLALLASHWHELPVKTLAFGGSRRWLATAGSEAVRIWSLRDHELLYSFNGHRRTVENVHVTGDAEFLFSCGQDRQIRLWESEPQRAAKRLTPQDQHGVAFSPDGRFLAICGQSDDDSAAVHLIDVASGRELRSRPGVSGRMSSVAFSPDGRHLAAAAYDSPVLRIYDRQHASHEDLVLPSSGCSSLAFSPDGLQLVAADNHSGALFMIDIAERRIDSLESHARSRIPSVAFSPSSRCFAWGGYDGSICLQYGSTGDRRCIADAHAGPVRAVRFSPDGKLLASAGDDGAIRLWNPDGGRPRATLLAHHGAVYALSFAPDGLVLASGGHDAVIRLWDVRTARPLATLPSEHNVISCLDFSPDGLWLAVGAFGGPAMLWNLEYYVPHIDRNGPFHAARMRR